MTTDEYIFPKIVSHFDDGVEFCYRFHYADKDINELHKNFMHENGWIDTGTGRFNSGNGTLHIYEKNNKEREKELRDIVQSYYNKIRQIYEPRQIIDFEANGFKFENKFKDDELEYMFCYLKILCINDVDPNTPYEYITENLHDPLFMDSYNASIKIWEEMQEHIRSSNKTIIVKI